MTKIRSVCVYCGSSGRGPASHHEAARRLGTMLAENGIRLVFGGGHIGLMGVTADAAIAAGGEVVGIIPDFLQDLELGHNGCSELIVTDSMHSRKQKMAELADGFAILPGGLGTLDEAFEIITWKQLRLHDKPIVAVNVDGYWTPLRAMVDQLTEHRYMRPEQQNLFRLVESVDDVLPALRAMPSIDLPVDSSRI